MTDRPLLPPAPRSLEEAQAIYTASLEHALEAITLEQIRVRFNLADRAADRLRREAKAAGR